MGGGSSESVLLLLGLSGGLLKGDLLLSCSLRAADWKESGWYELRAAKLGFSALFTGGGTGLASCTRRISPDRRGGGGEGGCDTVSFDGMLPSATGL